MRAGSRRGQFLHLLAFQEAPNFRKRTNRQLVLEIDPVGTTRSVNSSSSAKGGRLQPWYPHTLRQAPDPVRLLASPRSLSGWSSVP